MRGNSATERDYMGTRKGTPGFTGKLALLFLILCLLSAGCRSTWAVADDGFCADLTLADVRISYRYCKAGTVETELAKDAASERFLEAVEATLPSIVESAVRAALICAGVGAAGEAASAAACAIGAD